MLLLIILGVALETKFILIRHGQSLGNAAKIYLGHTDLDLSELGKSQAKFAAEYFKGEKISAIYSSDLLRAYNTALPHGELHNIDVIKSKELREVHVGEWEGLSVDEIRKRWPHEFDVLWHGQFGSMCPPGGEPVFLAGKRMYDKLLSIAKETDGVVLITSHAAIIRAFWCYAHGVEPSKWASFVPFPSNASASFVGFDGERLVPLTYSFDDYLSEKTSLTDA
jgi:broad specificity phosphatase PhoE